MKIWLHRTIGAAAITGGLCLLAAGTAQASATEAPGEPVTGKLTTLVAGNDVITDTLNDTSPLVDVGIDQVPGRSADAPVSKPIQRPLTHRDFGTRSMATQPGGPTGEAESLTGKALPVTDTVTVDLPGVPDVTNIPDVDTVTGRLTGKPATPTGERHIGMTADAIGSRPMHGQTHGGMPGDVVTPE
jgi:hypothetical protein